MHQFAAIIYVYIYMNIISNDLIHFNSNCQVDSNFWGVFNFPLENSGIAEGVSESISGKDLLVSRHCAKSFTEGLVDGCSHCMFGLIYLDYAS